MTLAVSMTTINVAYLAAGVLLIVGIKRLSSPATARSGNVVAAAGMAIALVFTLLHPDVDSYWLIAIGVAVGTVIGVVSARRVRMTAMPQMVALFNGVGGGAAALIAAAEFHRLTPPGGHVEPETMGAMLFSALVGSISFSGSLVAFGKLQELLPGRPLVFPGQQLVNALLFAALVGVGILAGATEAAGPWAVVLLAGALLFGVLLVLPIGGADMPVVISLLNAFTGLAAASAGFILENTALIIGGTLVGASGTLLTVRIGGAKNRSRANVLFGAFGAPAAADAVAEAASADGKSYREIGPEDAAVMLAYASRVVIVPGYGLAVAQAQHNVRELADLLERRGVDVKYGIHPVAGRMPGHMNVLLAEANVPYPQLRDMEDINPELPRTDVALVIGANDVTNPAARENPESPLYGMPILNVDQAANVVVLKRSMSPGFAGIENDLFYRPNTAMLFGDAKTSVERLVAAVKAA